jgi:hypothetical protein
LLQFDADEAGPAGDHEQVGVRCREAGSVVWGWGVDPLFVMKQYPHVEIVSDPLDDLETGLWILAHPDIRHLQWVKILFDFLKQNLTL